jgi:hypothetical protein
MEIIEYKYFPYGGNLLSYLEKQEEIRKSLIGPAALILDKITLYMWSTQEITAFKILN